MIFYIVLALIIIGMTFLARFAKESDRKIINIFIVALLIVVSASRNMVGADFPGYIEIYNHPDSEPMEPFFAGMNMVLRFFGFSYRAFFVVTSTISVLLFWDAIRRHSPFIYLSVVLYVLLGLYTTSFNIVRHFIALGIILDFAYPPLRDRNFKKFLAVIFLAAFFHISALFVLPLYFIVEKRIQLLYGVGGVLLAFVINAGYGVQQFVDVFSLILPGKYAGYLQFLPIYLKELDEPILLKVVNNMDKILICCFLFGYQKKILAVTPRFIVLINLFYYNLLFAIAARGIGPLQRFGFYFSIFSLLSIPLLVYIPSSKYGKLLLVITLVLVYFFYFIFIILNKNFGEVIPYQTYFN